MLNRREMLATSISAAAAAAAPVVHIVAAVATKPWTSALINIRAGQQIARLIAK